LSVQFAPSGLVALNVCLALIMFGISLDIKKSHFTALLDQKKAFVTGLISQIILLPVLTLLLVMVLPVSPGIALGMILVAACPGGNVSNFFSMLANGNVALSVTLTAISSLLAFIITPLSFFFFSSLIPALSGEVWAMEISFVDLFVNMVLILLLPLVAGMWMGASYPETAAKAAKFLRPLSMVLLFGFIAVAFYNNRAVFMAEIGSVFWIVLLHNGLALYAAYLFSKLLRNNEYNSRTVAIETGIQNSGLALVLIFTFFNGNKDMALIAAWWGIWHLISGFLFAIIIRRTPVTT
jgi:bile acid:Na+ symporter, BASS family